MMKNLFIILSTLFLISCSSDVEVPKDILKEEKMKAVLWDVMRAQYLATQIAGTDSLTTVAAETKVLTNKIFDIHHITPEEFEKSYGWYIKHPKLMSALFDSLLVQKQRDVNTDQDGRPLLRRPDKKLLLNE